MVRILLRPCASALAGLKRQSTPVLKSVALRSGAQALSGQDCVRFFSSGKDKKGSAKHTLHDKFNDEAVVEEIPAEVEFLSKEIDEKALLDETVAAVVPEVAEEEDDDESVLSAEEWAAKFEQEIANWDHEDGDFEDLEDDRIQIEMPNHDPSLLLSEDSSDDVNRDLFNNLEPGMAMGPEMLNWMLPKDQREVFSQGKEKPWKYFVKANHPDIVELALDVDLLRLFISPTGRIRPRRFTGLTAKQQRKLARAVKVSRQMALLPFLSRYPEPSPDQWKAMEEEEIAKLMAEAANDDGKDVVDDDEFDEDME